MSITSDDLSELAKKACKESLLDHFFKSINLFTSSEGIGSILRTGFNLKFTTGKLAKEIPYSSTNNKLVNQVAIELSFQNSEVTKPKHNSKDIRPNEALMLETTYAGFINVSGEIKCTPYMVDEIKEPIIYPFSNLTLGAIPIMVKSDKCNIADMDPKSLLLAHEDYEEMGGYFIVGGNEKVIISGENLIRNKPSYHLGLRGSIVSCNILSQFGIGFENSSETVITFDKSGAIWISLSLNKSNSQSIPFYKMYNALGVTSHKDIIQTIILKSDPDDPIRADMEYYMARAINLDYKASWASLETPDSILLYLMDELWMNKKKRSDGENNENFNKYKIFQSLEKLDTTFLPHMGITANCRIKKLIYLGYLIRMCYYVSKGIYQPTDRDHFNGKEIHPPGQVMSKQLKAIINLTAIQPVKKALIEMYSTINTFINGNPVKVMIENIKQNSMEESWNKLFNTGKKKIKIGKLETQNRMNIQTLERKNNINNLSVLRGIVADAPTSGKQSKRSQDLRSVHPSFAGGYISGVETKDGEKIGLNKQMAILCKITLASNPQYLRELLREDIVVIDEICRLSDVREYQMDMVSLNGELIGFCYNGFDLVKKYRMLRRDPESNINSEISIFIDNVYTGHVQFMTSMGRLTAPQLIVYNNLEEFIAGREPFKQYIKMTKDHIDDFLAGKITMDTLVHDQIIEYISVHEMDNCLLCPSLSEFRENEGNCLKQYTHLGIEIANFGIPALTVPGGNQSEGLRVSYASKQKEQTNGPILSSTRYRFDKGAAYSYLNQYPIARTFGDDIIKPCGMNVYVLMSANGFNQEDSVSLNGDAVKRGMFAVAYFNSQNEVLQNGEKLGIPDLDSKSKSVYSNLADGIIKVGSPITKGTPLIAKYVESSETDPNTRITRNVIRDTSIIYKKSVDAIVDGTMLAFNATHNRIGVVRTVSDRLVQPGDKHSARSGNKAVASMITPGHNMNFTESGEIPTIVLNPHSIPSRMILNQIIEGYLSEYCLMTGQFIDYSIFSNINIYELRDKLKEVGVTTNGVPIYDGLTGIRMNTLMFNFPNFYNRLKKYAVDDANASYEPKCSALTGQPVKGIGKEGGSKLGEMENHCLCSRGVSGIMAELAFKHSEQNLYPVCTNCGRYAIVNDKNTFYYCNQCEYGSQIVYVNSTKITKIVIEYLMAMGVDVTFTMIPPVFYQSE